MEKEKPFKKSQNKVLVVQVSPTKSVKSSATYVFQFFNFLARIVNKNGELPERDKAHFSMILNGLGEKERQAEIRKQKPAFEHFVKPEQPNKKYAIENSQKKPVNHILVLNYDNTLFCTERYSKSQLEGSMLKAMNKQIDKLLKTATQYGCIIYIITSLESILVKEICFKHLPALSQYLNDSISVDEGFIRIISAKDNQPDEQIDFNSKIMAFKELEVYENFRHLTNMISIGDSLYELFASYEFQTKIESLVLKFVKLDKATDLKQILAHLKKLNLKFDELFRQNTPKLYIYR